MTTPSNRELLRQYLAPLGFEIREAVNGREGLQAAAAWLPHLILMDMRMPELDGYAATAAIKAACTAWAIQPLIVAVTASAFEEERQQVLAAGCDEFLRKPVQAGEILAVIESLLPLRWRYAEALTDPTSQAARSSLDQELKTAPAELLQRLRERTEAGQMDQIEALIGELRPHAGELARRLAELADNFAYDDILELLA